MDDLFKTSKVYYYNLHIFEILDKIGLLLIVLYANIN